MEGGGDLGEGQITRDLARGGKSLGGRNPCDTGNNDILRKFLKISLYRDKDDVHLFTGCYLINLYIHFPTQEALKDIQTKETINRQRG